MSSSLCCSGWSNCWAQMIFLPQPPNGLSRIFEHNSSAIPSPPPPPLPLSFLPLSPTIAMTATWWSRDNFLEPVSSLPPFCMCSEDRTQAMLNSGHAELKGHAANAFTCPTSLHPSIIYKLSKLSKLDSCIYQFNFYYYKI